MTNFEKEHGQFVPSREVVVNYRPWMQQMVLYMRVGRFADGWSLFMTRSTRDKPSELMAVAPEQEPPVYLTIGDQEAEAIADAIRPRPQVNERHLEDAIKVRDRLLTLIEREHE